MLVIFGVTSAWQTNQKKLIIKLNLKKKKCFDSHKYPINNIVSKVVEVTNGKKMLWQ